jgi:predicted nucleic acid-binding protein
MVFSYQLADHPRYAPLASVVLEAVEEGRIAGLTTTVTLDEILAVPARAGDRQALYDYELYLTHFPNLEIVSLDVALARETALVRGATGLRTPDAIQVAAARLAGAGALVTNDRRWARQVATPRLLILDDYLD